ncbi:hypothetical protein BEN47_10790 [Hymenobacter lapidarius]|uniref:Uncharacterized protein n=1 Tax=Hymenobacter lapidarius TaxID=1908237 RepID=A0A1G1T951_9BACT|nr:hypothetical protein [Hymenobacter lapidarius]OGX87408.1 hypothetical protein BEN47_10790 [Hymenobacter lapidarius]
MKTLKTLLALVTALVATSLLLSLTTTLGIGSMFIYTFCIIVLFGWYVYLPFVFLHNWLFLCLNRLSWALSVLIGSGLASIIFIILVATPFTIVTEMPTFSASQAYDAMSFAFGGGLYGLFYWKWVASKKIVA